MPSNRLSRRGVLAGLASLPVAQPALAQRATQTDTVEKISIEATRIASFSRTGTATRFGRLEFRGGLVLKSSDKNFGGLSGLAIEGDGRRFLAVSDEGAWLSGEVVYQGSSPAGIATARMASIPGFGGRELTRKRDKDAEAVALVSGNLSNGEVLIAFERNHRIGRYPIANGLLRPPSGFLRMPPEAKRMSSNKGFEAITVLAGGPNKGAVVAISERFPDPGGQHVGWIWVAGEPRRFAFKVVGGFDVTDIAGLPDGSLLVLERRFRWTEGVKMQLRLLPSKDVAPGVSGSEGDVLLTADMSYEIDNMEALAVHRGPRGEHILTLLSDDNFNSLLQRTVLLQFALT